MKSVNLALGKWERHSQCHRQAAASHRTHRNCNTNLEPGCWSRNHTSPQSCSLHSIWTARKIETGNWELHPLRIIMNDWMNPSSPWHKIHYKWPSNSYEWTWTRHQHPPLLHNPQWLALFYICNGVVERRTGPWPRQRSRSKWRPQQAYGSNQVLFAQQQTTFQHTQNPHSHA